MQRKERQLTRLLQVTIPREAYIILGQLIQKRVENDFAPSKATKSAVMAEAILRMGIEEGVCKPPEPDVPVVPKTKPFEIVPISGGTSTGTDPH